MTCWQVKLKSTLRLLIPRLRNAQKKDTAISIADRREMADLLRQNREASARIRVENIIHTDITVELMEILELYAELLLARAGLLDVRDKNVKDGLVSKDAADEATGLEEAAASIIYAAPRLPRDVRELGLVRSMLIDRFGKDFALRAQENEGNVVPDRIVRKLSVEPPKADLVQAYLEEIARTYSVDWPLYKQDLDQARQEVDDEDDGDDGGAKEQPILADGAAPTTPKAKDLSLGPLPPRSQPNVEGSKSPVSVAPPGARTDNPNPKVNLPGGGQVKAQDRKPSAGGALGAPPTVDDLASRFRALGKKV